MVAPIVLGAAAIATRLAAKKVAQEAAKKATKTAAAKTAQIAKNSVKVKPSRTATGPGLETRGNKITTASQKIAAKKLIKDDQNNIMNSLSKIEYQNNFRGPSLKTIAKNKPVPRAAEKKLPVKINSNLSKSAKRTRSGQKAK